MRKGVFETYADGEGPDQPVLPHGLMFQWRANARMRLRACAVGIM